jgi:hypothetical protein
MPVIPPLRRLMLEDHEFQDSLGYTVRPSQKNRKCLKIIEADAF